MKSASNPKFERLEALIKRNIAKILQKHLKDPRLGTVTVTAIRLNRDLSVAKVLVTFASGYQSEVCQEKMQILNQAVGFIKNKLAQSLKNIKKIPDLKFVYDQQFERGFEIDELLKK